MKRTALVEGVNEIDKLLSVYLAGYSCHNFLYVEDDLKDLDICLPFEIQLMNREVSATLRDLTEFLSPFPTTSFPAQLHYSIYI